MTTITLHDAQSKLPELVRELKPGQELAILDGGASLPGSLASGPPPAALRTLPFHHRNPFDRLLVAQAFVEGGPILSADPLLDPYGIPRVW
jgi:hypothetical protein